MIPRAAGPLFAGLAFTLAALACRKPPPPRPQPAAAEPVPTPPPATVATVATVAPDAADEPHDLPLPPPEPDADEALLLGAPSADDASVDASLALLPDGAAAPREWRSIRGRHWQIVSPPGEPVEETDRIEGNRGRCLPGMAEVSGSMITGWMIEEQQKSVCTRWINRKFPERCGEFDRDKWLELSRSLPRKAMHFCIDRFEYPDRRGEYPILYVNWVEANVLCQDEGKRLCTEDEWTFACEGEEAMPYPYGYVRDPETCLVDKTWVPYFPRAFSTPEGTMRELDRLWQGTASGARPGCKSPFGVYDMTGNVDEWTRSSSSEGRPSVLKGGYWGPVRTRCRPSTRAHGELHAFYQQGLRCCAGVPPGDAGGD